MTLPVAGRVGLILPQHFLEFNQERCTKQKNMAEVKGADQASSSSQQSYGFSNNTLYNLGEQISISECSTMVDLHCAPAA